VYRLNTFPFIHLGIFHALVNILALTPLLERFEAEHGTLTTLALFAGREYLGEAPGEVILMSLYSVIDASGSIVHSHRHADPAAKHAYPWSQVCDEQVQCTPSLANADQTPTASGSSSFSPPKP
jgi:Rhomboid family